MRPFKPLDEPLDDGASVVPNKLVELRWERNSVFPEVEEEVGDEDAIPENVLLVIASFPQPS